MYRAFVVQVSDEYDSATRFLGRIEHVRSGEAVHFGSLDEFLIFLASALRGERKPD